MDVNLTTPAGLRPSRPFSTWFAQEYIRYYSEFTLTRYLLSLQNQSMLIGRPSLI